ncbi:hypothetical protein CFP56_018843 [Quercus suber]|uniref:Uncharacterized protein n=1 Tax=Quercus suber TaxID=58331 RepID=A0AAW0KIQ0_QUESU
MVVEEIYFSRVAHDGASTKIESSTFFISHTSSDAAELRQVKCNASCLGMIEHLKQSIVVV